MTFIQVGHTILDDISGLLGKVILYIRVIYTCCLFFCRFFVVVVVVVVVVLFGTACEMANSGDLVIYKFIIINICVQ